MRKFDTGATRDNDNEKIDYEGFLSPIVEKRYAQYMHKHRKQKDGTMRNSDNWTLGIPRDAYMKSLSRHFMDARLIHRGYSKEANDPDLQEVLCAVIFNAKGLLYEVLLDRDVGKGVK